MSFTNQLPRGSGLLKKKVWHTICHHFPFWRASFSTLLLDWSVMFQVQKHLIVDILQIIPNIQQGGCKNYTIYTIYPCIRKLTLQAHTSSIFIMFLASESLFTSGMD
jgi:hypothetical protein